MARRTQWKHGAKPATPPKHTIPWQQREAMRGVPFLRAPRPFAAKADKQLLKLMTEERAKEHGQ
jgi:hypothetical protein